MDKLQAVILGGILGFALSITKDYFFANKKKKTESYYLAIIVSASLERFISKCIEVACDEGEYDEKGYLNTRISTPNFKPMDLDVSWQSLEKELLYDILRLPEKINEANSYISAASEYAANPPDYEEFFEARHLRYSEVGLIACSILKKLQLLAKLPQNEPHGWVKSPEEMLSQQKSEVDKVIEARNKRNKETLKKISSMAEKNA